MNWTELLQRIGNEPVFKTGFLASEPASLSNIRLQLSRWVNTGKLIQLRRGIYTLADPYQKIHPEPFLLANTIKSASYVSLQSALAFYNMIPEYVPLVTSVTTGRPEEVNTSLGRFQFRHVKKNWFFGYTQKELSHNQTAFVAVPEKALLDLVYLTPGAATYMYLQQLRLQNTDRLDMDLLSAWATQCQSPKIEKAIKQLKYLIETEDEEEL